MPRSATPAWLLPHKDITQVERIGGHVALDFANTVSWRHQAREIEYLKTYRSLTAWAAATGLISPRDRTRLERVAHRAPRRAATAVQRARALREAIFRVGRSIAKGPPARAPRDAVSVIHAARLAALRHARFGAIPGAAWASRWGPTGDLDRPWWPVALAFADLLEHPGPHPLGICPDCSWLYCDSSRNRSRRWCSSGDCGNRARGARFRARHAG